MNCTDNSSSSSITRARYSSIICGAIVMLSVTLRVLRSNGNGANDQHNGDGSTHTAVKDGPPGSRRCCP